LFEHRELLDLLSLPLGLREGAFVTCSRDMKAGRSEAQPSLFFVRRPRAFLRDRRAGIR
jgi:hypothetical protein